MLVPRKEVYKTTPLTTFVRWASGLSVLSHFAETLETELAASLIDHLCLPASPESSSKPPAQLQLTTIPVPPDKVPRTYLLSSRHLPGTLQFPDVSSFVVVS